MLANLLASQRAHFAALAESWLASGASAFGVWSNGKSLAHWPDKSQLHQPSLVVPICFDDKILGELRVAGIDDPTAQIRLATEASLMSQLVRLEEDLQTMTAELVDSQDRLLAVYQLTRSLRKYTTIDETLRGLLCEAMRLLKVQTGFAVFASLARDSIVEQYPTGHVDDSVIGVIFRQAQASEREVVLSEDSDLTDYPSGTHNLCFVPIRVRGVIMAGLGLLNKPAGFAMPDVKLARALVEQAGGHIEDVLLHQETAEQIKIQSELDLARRVQLRLLPQQIPAVSDLDIFAHSRPARQVGGDFFDFIWQPNRSLIFAVGDVSGKALSAALLMTMTRTAIHSKASYMPNPTPELVMRNSNEDLFDDFLQVGMFATTFIGQYQPHSRTLLYANAGHSPVIYCPAGGSARLLGADSPPLGVLNRSLCKNHAIALGPGDLLVVATDGFNEARSPDDEMFGYDRLLRLIEGLAARPSRTIADALFATVEKFGVGRPQDDDQTLVVIKGVAT